MNNPMVQGTTRYTDRLNEDAPYTRFVTGIVEEIKIDGYTVKINGTSYTKLMVLNGVSLSVNNTVQVVIPNNQDSNMFILGKLSL